MSRADNAPGGYAYLPGLNFASNGVIALPGFTIVRAVLPQPVALADGFAAIERHLARVRRPLAALCGIELRSPQSLPAQGFRDFNSVYNAQIEAWGLRRDERVPLARTNVAPAANPPATPSVLAFSYTVPRDDAPPAFVISGAAELPDGTTYPDDIVRRDETSDDALAEKARVVAGMVAARLEALGTRWDDAATVHVYSTHAIVPQLARDALAGLGIVPAHGLIWHDTAPPVADLALEIDARRYDRELLLADA